MEDELSRAGLQHPLPSATQEDLRFILELYGGIEKSAAWQDLTARIGQLRLQTIERLVHGTLDKFGNVQDNECRAVLLALERILSYLPTWRKDYNELMKKHQELARRKEQARQSFNQESTFASYERRRGVPI